MAGLRQLWCVVGLTVSLGLVAEIAATLGSLSAGKPLGEDVAVAKLHRGEVPPEGAERKAGTLWTAWWPVHFNEVIHDGQRFVAVGDGGAVLTSPDGASWTRWDSGTDRHLFGLAHGKGLFVAVGRRGTVLTSKDGEVWAKQDLGVPDWLHSVAHGGGRFVAVGDAGTALTSP